MAGALACRTSRVALGVLTIFSEPRQHGTTTPLHVAWRASPAVPDTALPCVSAVGALGEAIAQLSGFQGPRSLLSLAQGLYDACRGEYQHALRPHVEC